MVISTSDWIAIIIAIASIASTWGAVFWQVRKTLPSAAPPETNPIALNSSNRMKLFRRYWASFLTIAFCISGLIALFWLSAKVDKPFIVLCIFFSSLCALHILAILFFEFMRDYSDYMIGRLLPIVGREEKPNLTVKRDGAKARRPLP